MLSLATTLIAVVATSTCDGVATRDVWPANAGAWCPVSEVPLTTTYCDGSQPEVCAFLEVLPDDARVRCVSGAVSACAVTVARDGGRRFYALHDSPAVRALARESRWAAAPVSLTRAKDGTFWFDPRHCPGCAYSSPQLELLQQHGLPLELQVLDENVSFNARNCTLSAEVPRAEGSPAQISSIKLDAEACASEAEYWETDSGS